CPLRARQPRQRPARRAGVRVVRCARAHARRHREDRPSPRHAGAMAERARDAGHDRVLRSARRRPGEVRRDGRRLGRRRRGRPDGRPARQGQGLSRRRHRRRTGEVRLGRARARLRRLHRLQVGPDQGRAEGELPERRRRLLRQRRRRDPRRRADAAQPQGADRHLRRDQSVQQYRRRQGPGELPVAPRPPRADGRDGRVRLCRALPRCDRRARVVPEGRPDQEPRRHRRRLRHLPRNAAQALSRRELRQAHPAGRRALTGGRWRAAPAARLRTAVRGAPRSHHGICPGPMSDAPYDPGPGALSTELLQAFLVESRELLAVTDGSGRLLWVNARFSASTGHNGRPTATLLDYTLPGAAGSEARLSLARMLSARERENGVFQLLGGNGEPFWVDARCARVGGGRIAWMLVDVTITRALAARAARQEELLETAQEFGRLGIWEREIPSGEGRWDKHVFGFWGLDPADGTPNYSQAIERIHADDRAASIYPESTRRAGRYSQRYRVVHPDGKTRWIHSQWEVK